MSGNNIFSLKQVYICNLWLSQPFGDYWRKMVALQMQKCSRQIVQEQKLRLEPHLISIVVQLLELNMLKTSCSSCMRFTLWTNVFERLWNASCLHTEKRSCFMVISRLQQITKIAQCILLWLVINNSWLLVSLDWAHGKIKHVLWKPAPCNGICDRTLLNSVNKMLDPQSPC